MFVKVCVGGYSLHCAPCPAGADAHVDALGVDSVLVSLSGHKLLDERLGRIYTISLSHDFLLQLLSPTRPEAQRLAALHCVLLHLRPDQDLEKKVGQRKRSSGCFSNCTFRMRSKGRPFGFVWKSVPSSLL